MAELRKLSVSQLAAELDTPFSMVNVARVGETVVSIYICQGTVEWHRHLDADELFWVHEGTILLESEWGEVRLRPGELVVVPKGVGHRSGSELRASVLLLRCCELMASWKNGRRRLYAIAGEAKLERVGLRGVAQAVGSQFQFQTVAQIDDSVVQVARGEGTWPVEIPAPHDLLLFVLEGTATARSSESLLHLHPGDFTVVPHGAIYQLSTTRGTALVQLTDENVT